MHIHTYNTKQKHSIDALLLHLVLLEPALGTVALSPESSSPVAALCSEGEGAGPLPPGAAFEVRRNKKCHVRFMEVA